MAGLRGVLLLEEQLLANMCPQRMEWNRFEDIGGSERKDISRGSGCAWISQHKLHHTHVSLFLHRTKSAICTKNTFTCTERVTPQVPFSDSADIASQKRAMQELGVLRMSGRRRFLSVLSASWRNRNRERGRGDHERELRR